MKIALSIPDELFATAEALTKRLGVSRSGLYAAALTEYVAKHQSAKVTERLNAVYSSENSRLERPFRRAQARTVSRDQW
jgi:metal-responsive CopG/Arc/MetJ family transcriptional regulator